MKHKHPQFFSSEFNKIIFLPLHIFMNYLQFTFSLQNLVKLILSLSKMPAGCRDYNFGKKKLKVTLVQALRLCTGRTAHRGSRGIAVLFHDHGTRRGLRVSVTPRPLFTPGKDTVPVVQEAGWATGPVCTGTENLASHWDSIPGPSSP